MTNAGDGAPINPEHSTPQQPESSPPKPKAKRTRVVLLSVLIVLLLGATGAFAALYFSEKSDHQAMSAQLAEKDTQLAERDKAVADAAAAAHSAQIGQLNAQENSLTLGVCHDAVVTFRKAMDSHDDAQLQNAIGELYTDCA